MKVNLYIDFYFDKNPERFEELRYCLEHNLNNDLIDHVVVYADEKDADRLFQFLYEFKSVKILTCFKKNRPTYNDFFVAMNHVTHKNDINIISNADIYFDKTSLQRMKDFNWNDHCMALTRWDELETETRFNHQYENIPQISFYDYVDAWVFKGYTEQIAGADFTLGVPGCDNRIAYLLSRSGFKVINPSRTIKIIHKHKSGIRNYNFRQTIKPPYLTLQPTELL